MLCLLPWKQTCVSSSPTEHGKPRRSYRGVSQRRPQAPLPGNLLAFFFVLPLRGHAKTDKGGGGRRGVLLFFQMLPDTFTRFCSSSETPSVFHLCSLGVSRRRITRLTSDAFALDTTRVPRRRFASIRSVFNIAQKSFDSLITRNRWRRRQGGRNHTQQSSGRVCLFAGRGFSIFTLSRGGIIAELSHLSFGLHFPAETPPIIRYSIL